MPNQDPDLAHELLAHHAFLRRLAVDLVGKDADDLVQDVWQRALERPPHHGGQLRGWLARVARNLAANRWRGEARRSDLERRRASERPVGEELEERFELRRALVEAVDSLGQPSRETILLRYFEGLSPRDIAQRQGVPVATVKTRLRRGLAQLREVLDERHGGDRATWMSAVTAIAAPVSSEVSTGTLVIGGMVMGTVMKVSAAALVAAACLYFATRTPRAELLPMAAVEPLATGVNLEDVELLPADPASDSAGGSARRSPVAEDPAGDESAAPGSNVLRVVLEGIPSEDARRTRVTVSGVDHRREWPSHFRDSWPARGSTSEFDLDPFLASVAGATNWDLRVDELQVRAYHPEYRLASTRVLLSHGVALKSGRTVYEARVQMVPGAPHVFWPELTLAVRDARTRAHLEDVELRCVPTAFMGGQRPGTGEPYTLLGGGLSSPIVLLGGRETDGPEDDVVGLALGPAEGEALQLAELSQPEATERGVLVFARAPGYAWGRIVLDVSTGADRELLLGPATALDVQFSNLQLERYAALETYASLLVTRPDPRGGADRVWSQKIDGLLETDGLLIDGLEPAEYVVSVELGGALSWRKRPVLANEELSLTAGETRELALTLADPPAPPARATLGGVVSFPAPTATWGEERVRLQLYKDDYRYGSPDFELSLADLEQVAGALPTWSFRMEEVPVGLYQVRLWPFLTSWMIELPADGAEDVELVIPEIAEVLVETVDAQTDERVPLEVLRFGSPEVLPGQVNKEDGTVAFEGEPGRFRFWMPPGAAYVRTNSIPDGLHYGMRSKDLELVSGLQSVRFELEPVYAIRIEFHDGGALLPRDDDVWVGVSQTIRAVDHEGRVTANRLPSDRLVEVSTPGVYEVSFEGIGADRFFPIPPRRVDVRAGETAEVIVELRRK